MRWTATRFGVTRYMIQLWCVSAHALWDWLNKPCVHNPMDAFGGTTKPNLSVTSSCERGGPQPAARACVDHYLGEKPRDLVACQIVYDEILLVSHARVLHYRVRVWLGSGMCFRTLSTRSLYLGLESA